MFVDMDKLTLRQFYISKVHLLYAQGCPACVDLLRKYYIQASIRCYVSAFTTFLLFYK